MTSQRCRCQDPPVWMRLVEAQRDPRDCRAYLVPEIEADELIGDEEPASAETVPAPPSEAAAIVDEPALAEIPPPPEEAFFAPEPEIVEIQPFDESAIAESPPGPPAIADSTSPAVETGKAEESTAESSGQKPKGKGKGKRSRRRSSRKRNRRRSKDSG